MSIDDVPRIAYVPLTSKWIPVLWPHLERDNRDIPKSWPRTPEELETWALGARKQQTIADRSIIVMENKTTGEFEAVGLITGDLVRGNNFSKFPGAEFGDVNIAYLVFSEYRGRGFAQRALRDVASAWIENGNHPVLRIASDNLASRRVAEATGFIRVQSYMDGDRELFLYRATEKEKL